MRFILALIVLVSALAAVGHSKVTRAAPAPMWICGRVTDAGVSGSGAASALQTLSLTSAKAVGGRITFYSAPRLSSGLFASTGSAAFSAVGTDQLVAVAYTDDNSGHHIARMVETGDATNTCNDLIGYGNEALAAAQPVKPGKRVLLKHPRHR